MRNAGTAFTFLIIAGFVTTVIAMQWYPAILVRASEKNGGRAHILWEFQIQRVADSALTYYKNALANASSSLPITESVQKDAYAKSADTLIENAIVADAIKTKGLDADAATLVTKKVAEYSAQPNFSVAVSLVYGLTDSSFLELIAKPEAERELLKAKNNWDDTALAAWIAEEKKQSRIVRFFQ